MSAHLAISAALVPCQGADHPGGLAGQRRGDRGGGALGVVAAGQRHNKGAAAGSLHEGGHRAAVGFAADDEVALPVSGL